MRGRLILAESSAAGLRAALTVDGRLEAVEIDPPARSTRIGIVATARVERQVQGLGLVVRLPDGSEALLDRGGKDIPPAGNQILVQIVRDAWGRKMQGASRAVSLVGRAFVHLPFESGVRTSRRLAGDKADSLTTPLRDKPGAWIVRGAATHLEPGDVLAEIDALTAEADSLGPKPSPPPDAIRRLLADYGAVAPDRLEVSGRQAESSLTAWCRAFAPSLVPLIVRYGDPGSLFDVYDLDRVVAALHESRVALPSGGSLVIERTEALTAIDVNSGEAGVLDANLAAASEIARQLRLRHIGGIVVVDFISMAKAADRKRVQAALSEALADDPAQTHVLPMSSLGLIEMTRERRGPEPLR